MKTKLKETIDKTLVALDIDKQERPELAGLVESVAEEFYNLGRNVAIMDASRWISDRIDIEHKVETDEEGQPLAGSYLSYMEARLNAANEAVDMFKKFMNREIEL